MVRECSVYGCSKPSRARGLCVMHYMRWKRRGTTDKNMRFTLTGYQRFMVTLMHIDGVSQRDIAKEMGITRHQVRKTLCSG